MFYGIRSKSVEYTVIFDGLYNTKSECEYRTYLVKIMNAQKVFLRFESRVSCTLQGRSIVFAKKKGGGRQTKKDYHIKLNLSKKEGVPSFVVTSRPKRYKWRTFQNIGLQIRKQGFL